MGELFGLDYSMTVGANKGVIGAIVASDHYCPHKNGNESGKNNNGPNDNCKANRGADVRYERYEVEGNGGTSSAKRQKLECDQDDSNCNKSNEKHQQGKKGSMGGGVGVHPTSTLGSDTPNSGTVLILQC